MRGPVAPSLSDAPCHDGANARPNRRLIGVEMVTRLISPKPSTVLVSTKQFIVVDHVFRERRGRTTRPEALGATWQTRRQIPPLRGLAWSYPSTPKRHSGACEPVAKPCTPAQKCPLPKQPRELVTRGRAGEWAGKRHHHQPMPAAVQREDSDRGVHENSRMEDSQPQSLQTVCPFERRPPGKRLRDFVDGVDSLSHSVAQVRLRTRRCPLLAPTRPAACSPREAQCTLYPCTSRPS